MKHRPVTVARGPVPRDRPVGETSWSRCNIKVLRTLLGCGTFFYRHSGSTDLKEVFDGPEHGEGQALALRKGAAFFSEETVPLP